MYETLEDQPPPPFDISPSTCLIDLFRDRISLASLELSVVVQAGFASQRSGCLCLLSTEIKGICYHAWL